MASTRKDIQINLRVPAELAELLDKEAGRTRTNRSWVIREALHRYFDHRSTDGEYTDDDTD